MNRDEIKGRARDLRGRAKQATGVLTGNERLGRKWMDEQRIDNCNVPVDKRGTRSRPGTCPHLPAG